MRPMFSCVLTRREGDGADMAKRAQPGTNLNAEAIGKDEQLKPRVHIPDRAGEVMARATSSIQDALREVSGLECHKLLTELLDERVRVGAQAERLVVRRLEPRH
jgi:hypothetical protein